MQGWDAPGYTEIKALGSGGFGDVVLARHEASGNLVAIKYLRRTLLDDPEFAAMFRDEARVLASLDNPNVVRLYEYIESPAGAAIVMELIDGVSLREILDQQGQTSAEAALVVLQGSLLGLAAAHARNVVHRDYKPANVLVDQAGVSKLTDFGIAARAGDRQIPAGTLAYAPPEQFDGGPASPASDVYAATATFYECLTGHPPFTGDTTELLRRQHQSEPVPLDPVPEPLRPLVAAGMHKDPSQRPANATAFVATLRRAAGPAYGLEWEDRGRSHLGEATLLLAALWPSNAAPAVQGHAVEQIHLSHGAGEDPHVEHLKHLEHLRHLEHDPSGPAQPAEHAQHVEHLQHAEHLAHEHAEHVKHIEHVEHLQHEASQSTRFQHLVRQASRSRRVPRFVRRSLPHNPGPGLAAGITAGVAAAAVVVVGAIVAVAAVVTSGGSAPQAASAIATPRAAGTNTSVAGSYTFSRQMLTCTGWTCLATPLPITIACSSADSCVVSSSHWGSSHEATFNGSTISFSGTDVGVVDCNSTPIPATLTFDLTVVSWTKGSGSVRQPQKLQGPYSYSAAADDGCPLIQSKEILTYAASTASAPAAGGSSASALNPSGFALPVIAATGSPSLNAACRWQYPSDPTVAALHIPNSSSVAAYTVQCVGSSGTLGGLDLSGYCASLVSGMVATNPDTTGPATDQPPPFERWECVPGQ
jgi:serine/threonine protein kinase